MRSSGIRQQIFNEDRTKLRTDREGDIGNRIWHTTISRLRIWQTLHSGIRPQTLQPIFTKPILNAPPRIQRFRLKLQKYDMTIKFTPGKDLAIADTLSRAFLPRLPEDELNLESQVYVHMVLNNLPISDEMLRTFFKLRQAKTKGFKR